MTAHDSDVTAVAPLQPKAAPTEALPTESVPDFSDEDLRIMVRTEIQRVLTSLPEFGHSHAPISGSDATDEIASLRDELVSTRADVQRLRAAKEAQDREMVIKEQIRTLGVR